MPESIPVQIADLEKRIKFYEARIETYRERIRYEESKKARMLEKLEYLKRN